MNLIPHKCGLWVRPGALTWQDDEVINEVLREDCYRVRDLPPSGPGEAVIDIGSHIGAFALAWRRHDHGSRIVCVEANPDNLECLTFNVGDFAQVLHAACTYEREFEFFNSICEGGSATGGSYLAAPGEAMTVSEIAARVYRRDERPLEAITLERVLKLANGGRIHVLKLDCEGSEFSILENTSLLPRTHYVIGEYHGLDRWEACRRKVFGEQWHYQSMRGGEIGWFTYENRNYDTTT